MHGAKGQEFDLVFLAGWDEGVFPLLPRGQLSSTHHADTLSILLEEERRLAYVVRLLPPTQPPTHSTFSPLDPATHPWIPAPLSNRRVLFYPINPPTHPPTHLFPIQALTRARLNAYITFTHRRRLPGGAWATTTPSRFIGELPRRLVRLKLLGKQPTHPPTHLSHSFSLINLPPNHPPVLLSTHPPTHLSQQAPPACKGKSSLPMTSTSAAFVPLASRPGPSTYPPTHPPTHVSSSHKPPALPLPT